MMIIAIHCDSLCTNCRFVKTSLIDSIQTPIKQTMTAHMYSFSTNNTIHKGKYIEQGLYFVTIDSRAYWFLQDI